MSIFAGPKSHAANPPETWVVEKVGRRWGLLTADGVSLTTAETKRAAEELRTEGFYADLYEKERRWYAGESIHGWKSHAEVFEENKSLAERWPDGLMAARMREEYDL